MATIFNTVIINNVLINVHHNTITGGKNNFNGIVINNFAVPPDFSGKYVDDIDSIVVQSDNTGLEESLKKRLLLVEKELEESRKQCEVLRSDLNGEKKFPRQEPIRHE